MAEYSALAAKRYRQYMRRKQNESLIRRLVTLILRILHVLIETLQRTRLKKARKVQKIDVEKEES
ncbi:MAG: hypothetical protein M3269_02460 [Thermoproteota archaeon]|nr:hypothetical protein [Thermoproteota archaeon]MDQ3727590.1 hypothetical protein [Thermoproteota archaeon]MDQ5831108.1 hypothetical protein [Thermoproteota archaeon]MDQ5859483.1 hypothetical protein [Thermoproteota archaeon]